MKLNLQKFFEWYDGNPLITNPWMADTPITLGEISNAILAKDFQEHSDYLQVEFNRNYHIKRIAYMVVNRQSMPIDVDFGIPSLGYYPNEPIYDGWHRIMAALYLHQPYIECDYSGEDSFAKEFEWTCLQTKSS